MSGFIERTILGKVSELGRFWDLRQWSEWDERSGTCRTAREAV